MRRIAWISMLAVLATLLTCGFAEPDTVTLGADPRLATRVDRTVVDGPLPAVLSSLGAELGLSLVVDTSCADLRVTLQVKERPAGKLLDSLANLLNLKWRRTAKGFLLYEDPLARQQVEAGRRAALDKEWRLTREWVQRVGRTSVLSPAALKELERDLAQRLRDPALAEMDRQHLEQEHALLKEARRPGMVEAVAVLASLTPAQVERLRKGGDLLLTAADLPPRVAAQVKAIQGADLPFQNSDEFPVWADVLVQYRDWAVREGPPKRGEFRHALSVELVGTREREGKREWTAVHWQPSPPPHPAKAIAPSDDVDLNCFIQLEVPQRKRAALERLGGSETAFTWESRLWPAWPTLGEVAQHLHRATGIEFLAESFTRARIDPNWIRGRRTVASLLNEVATELDYTWQRDGKLVCLSSRSPGRDRSMEAPQRIVRPWQERVSKQAVAGLDDAAELASKLDDDQALGLTDHWGWYFEGPWVAPAGNLYADRRHLRLWASLSAAQRREALAGAVIPVERMSAAQARAFVAALEEPVRSPWGPSAEFRQKHPRVTLVDVRGGGFSLKAEQAWFQQLYLGAREDGSQVRILARRPSYRPANLANLPAEFQWSPLGRETPLDTYTFNYLLAGRQKPARSVELEVIRPPTEGS